MNPFDAIQHVGTPLALAAFVVAAAAYVFRARLVERRKLIDSAPPEKRAELLDKVIDEFSKVDPATLTKEQRYQLGLRLIEERVARFRTTALAGTGIALLLAIVIVVGADDDPTTGLTVRVQRPGGELATAGDVTLDAGRQHDTRALGTGGEVHFENVLRRAFEDGVVLTPRVPGFRVAAETLKAAPAAGAVTLLLEPQAASFFGTVVDADGRPLPDVLVLLDGGAAVDTTDGHGRFRAELARAPGTQVAVRLLRGDVVGFNDLVVLPADEALTLRFAPR